MKVLLYNYEYPPIGGGAGRASARIASYLAGRGHHVHVVTSAWADHRDVSEEDGVSILRLPARRKHADRSGVAQMSAYMASAMAWTLANARRLSGWVALAFFGIPGGPPALLLRTLSRCPYVLSLRGGDVPGFQSGAPRVASLLARPILHMVWHRAHALTTNSRSLAELAHRFRPLVPVEVIPNGVDLDCYRPGERRQSAGPCRIVSIGRLARQKEFDTLIRAVARVREAPVELRIVGDGPERPRLESLARDLGAPVRFEGWREPAEVSEALRQSDVFALLTHGEGMSNALLEGMASGLPIVATDLPANREVIGETLDGECLVGSGDVEGAARLLARLASRPDERVRVGTLVRERAEQFSWEATGRRHEELLLAAAQGDAAAGSTTGRPSIRPFGLLELPSRYASALATTITMPSAVRQTPLHIQVEPSSFCNLDCSFCSRSKVIKKPRNMKIEQFREVLETMRPHKITLSGYGEPLLHPEIHKLIALGKEMGAEINTTSNGILLNEARARALIDAGLDLLSISLDSARKETYETVRGKDEFDRIVENARQFVRMRREAGRRKPYLRLCFVVTSINLGEIPAFVDLAREIGADSILFQILELTGIEEKKAFLAGAMSREELERQLRLGDDRARRHRLTTNLPRLLRELDDSYRKYQLAIDDHKLCPLPFFSTYLTATGELMPCCRFAPTPVSMGNVFQGGLAAVWNGKKYGRIREEFKKGGRPFPICRNCVPETVAEIMRRAPISPGFLSLW